MAGSLCSRRRIHSLKWRETDRRVEDSVGMNWLVYVHYARHTGSVGSTGSTGNIGNTGSIGCIGRDYCSCWSWDCQTAVNSSSGHCCFAAFALGCFGSCGASAETF